MSKTIYSPDVLEYSEQIIECIQDTADVTGLNFFEEEFADPVIGCEMFKQLLCETATRNFLEREDGEFRLDKEQLTRCMQESIVRASLESLRQKGLVDWIENENGDEVIFLTEKARVLRDSLVNTYDNDENLNDQ